MITRVGTSARRGACLAMLTLAAAVTPAAANTGTLVHTNCGPAASAADGTMVWKALNVHGMWDAYIGDGSCNGAPLLPAYNGERGPSDITRDGRYVLLVTAVGGDKATLGAAPGKGSNNAIQLYDRQTGKLSTLLPSGIPSQRGVIWPKFNASGTKIAWAQMVKTPVQAPSWGDWDLHVANVDLSTGTLSNDRAWHDPAGGASLSEAYGWIPGTHRLIFMSTTRPTGSGVRSFQLWTLPDDFTATTAPTRISPKMNQPRGQQPNDVYHEFASFWPGDPNTLYTSIGSDTLGGADLWAYDLRTQQPDGLLGQARRVSWFGGDPNANLGLQAVPGFPRPRYAAVVAAAWESGAWVAGVCPEPNCTTMDAYRITDDAR
jgi:hypothetical protein